jgi:hypothetical protein
VSGDRGVGTHTHRRDMQRWGRAEAWSARQVGLPGDLGVDGDDGGSKEASQATSGGAWLEPIGAMAPQPKRFLLITIKYLGLFRLNFT